MVLNLYINAAHTHVLALMVNIYNHQELRHQLKINMNSRTESDCEVILALYQEKGIDFLMIYRYVRFCSV